MGLTRAQENVEMIIRDSVIRGDVVATDDAKITLINTVVESEPTPDGEGPGTGGNVIASGNGLVTLIDSQVQGEIRTEGRGEVVVQ